MSAKKTAPKNNPKDKKAGNPVLLALTLLPLVSGVLLLGAWALDITLVGTLDSQIWLGALLILCSFALSNLVQKNWMLFAGWTLLVAADVLLLMIINFQVQMIAFGIAAVGIILLSTEFYRRWRNRPENKNGQ